MAANPEFDTSQTAWISRGFEVLANCVRENRYEKHFDVLIVGSGYGGAIAADHFSGRKDKNGRDISVAVLERGKEYLSGAFPAGLRELPRHLRRKSNKEGLFDIRLGADVTTVVANGVGGGSLINAGVMAVPANNVEKGWPDSRNPAELGRASTGLTVAGTPQGVANTILTDPDNPPQKYRSRSRHLGRMRSDPLKSRSPWPIRRNGNVI
jgi:hypothetical protein